MCREGWNDRELDEETFGKGTVRKYENEHRFRQCILIRLFLV